MSTSKVSRRTVLAGAGAGALAAGAVGVGLASVTREDLARGASATDAVPFEGPHQAGIVTPAQDRLHFVVFDVTTESRRDVIALLKRWTEAARSMVEGHQVGATGATGGSIYAPPDDTGEALGLPPSQLTLTIGFGPSFFTDASGRARFGLDGARPDALDDLPAFAGDRLDPSITGGDIAIQACSNDPQVAVHAVRNLVRLSFGTAAVRWSQLGFGRTSSTSSTQETPRNLFGFKDGTANIKAEETGVVDKYVWSDGGPAWMRGGSYLVARKIAMHIEIWDRESLQGQEQIIGRTKKSGAPLSGGSEFSAVNLDAKTAAGIHKVPMTSHVRLAHPKVNGGVQILRRGYNYVDGSDGLGQLSAGLFFISYQAHPEQFVGIQRRLAGQSGDALNEYITHIGSALFACPPGVGARGYWGEGIFA